MSESLEAILGDHRVRMNYQDTGSTFSRCLYHLKIRKIPAITFVKNAQDRRDSGLRSWINARMSIIALSRGKP